MIETQSDRGQAEAATLLDEFAQVLRSFMDVSHATSVNLVAAVSKLSPRVAILELQTPA